MSFFPDAALPAGSVASSTPPAGDVPASPRARASIAIPAPAHATASAERAVIRSARKAHPMTVTAAGIGARITPAEPALVMLTPTSMQAVEQEVVEERFEEQQVTGAAKKRRLAFGARKPVRRRRNAARPATSAAMRPERPLRFQILADFLHCENVVMMRCRKISQYKNFHIALRNTLRKLLILLVKNLSLV